MAELRALSLWQPYASALALGLKTYETRPFTPKFRGEVLICSTKRWENPQRLAAARIARRHNLPQLAPERVEDLCGQALAIGRLVDVYRTEDLQAIQSAQEIALGDWGPGRRAWLIEDVRPLRKPFQIRGKQGLWTPTEEIARAARVLVGEPSSPCRPAPPKPKHCPYYGDECSREECLAGCEIDAKKRDQEQGAGS